MASVWKKLKVPITALALLWVLPFPQVRNKYGAFPFGKDGLALNCVLLRFLGTPGQNWTTDIDWFQAAY